MDVLRWILNINEMKTSTPEIFRNFKFEYRITVIYLVFGILWILFSDKVLDMLEPDDSLLTKLQTFKGSFFIVVTSVFLYLLVKRHMQKLRIAENQRLESEFRFSKLWENGPFGLMIVSKEFQYKNVNPEFCKILGYSEEELLQLTFKEISHPDDLAKDLPNIRKLINKEVPLYKTEKRYIRKGGQVIWGALTVFPNYDNEGNFLYNLGIVEDITRRKLAEEDLKNSKRLLAESESIGKVGGWEFNIETLETTWTEEVYRIHEVDFDFFHNVNKGINFYTPESRPVIDKAIQRVIEFGEPFDLELEIITAKGNLKNVHTIGKPDIENHRVYGFFQDITERKQKEDTLKKLKYILSEGQKIAHIGTFEYIVDTQTTYWSSEEYSIYGLDAEGPSPTFQVMLAKCIHPDDAAMLNQTFAAAIQSHSVYELEHRIMKPDGSIRWVVDRAAPYFDQNGKLDRYVGTTLDITGRKKAEENIRLLNEQLEQRVFERTLQLEAANKELEAFSYSVSHDLRSPLRHINGYAEILIKQYSENLPEDARKYLNTITGATKKMGTLIDDLLSFSRTGRTDLRKSTFKMNKVVDEALEQIKLTIGDRKIDWAISLLPEIYGDYNLLRQVWINLIDNAVKYTQAKENTVIEAGYYENNKETVFYIKDNGVGFDIKYADKLFGVFQRLHSSSQFDGTGIGLANVQRIILRHGGRIWAESEPDKGASFFFSIPKQLEDKT